MSIQIPEHLEGDYESMVGHMESVLEILWGYDYKSNPSRADTASRFVKYLLEFHQAGFYADEDVPYDIVKGTFPATGSEKVGWIEQFNMPFNMICEHHLLPAFGKAHLAYKSSGSILGLSKFPRLVDLIGRSDALLQEVFTQKLLDILVRLIEPRELLIIVDSEHTCVRCRGVERGGIDTVTKAAYHKYGQDMDYEMQLFSQQVAIRTQK